MSSRLRSPNRLADLLNRLDEIHRRERPHAPELDARIDSYSLAARMQLSAGEALDLTRENEHTLAMYGVGEQATDSFGRRCLLARRLVERGVRFVQIFLEEQPWDSHVDLAANHRGACLRTDKPVAGLLRDLKQRGLAGFHARDLGRRIRTHTDFPEIR